MLYSIRKHLSVLLTSDGTIWIIFLQNICYLVFEIKCNLKVCQQIYKEQYFSFSHSCLLQSEISSHMDIIPFPNLFYCVLLLLHTNLCKATIQPGHNVSLDSFYLFISAHSWGTPSECCIANNPCLYWCVCWWDNGN